MTIPLQFASLYDGQELTHTNSSLQARISPQRRLSEMRRAGWYICAVKLLFPLWQVCDSISYDWDWQPVCDSQVIDICCGLTFSNQGASVSSVRASETSVQIVYWQTTAAIVARMFKRSEENQCIKQNSVYLKTCSSTRWKRSRINATIESAYWRDFGLVGLSQILCVYQVDEVKINASNRISTFNRTRFCVCVLLLFCVVVVFFGGRGLSQSLLV